MTVWNGGAVQTVDGQLVTFEVAHLHVALPVGAVREVVAAATLTPAGAGGMLVGLLNLRGQLLPVFSLRLALRLPDIALEPRQYIVIADQGDTSCGLIVDRLGEVRSYEGAAIQPVDAAFGAGVVGAIHDGDRVLLIPAPDAIAGHQWSVER